MFLREQFESEQLAWVDGLTVEPKRDEAGRVTSGHLNPAGHNQYTHPRVRIEHAIARRLEEKPECVESFVDKVETALQDPEEKGNLDLLRYALPSASRIGVELSGPGGGPVEVASAERLDDLTSSFRERVAGGAGVAEGEVDGAGTQGAD